MDLSWQPRMYARNTFFGSVHKNIASERNKQKIKVQKKTSKEISKEKLQGNQQGKTARKTSKKTKEGKQSTTYV